MGVSSKMKRRILEIALQSVQCCHCPGRGGCDGKRGRLTDAFIVLFGLLYALNVEKNKELKYMFEFFQQVFLNIRNKSTRGVQSLRTKLSQM